MAVDHYEAMLDLRGMSDAEWTRDYDPDRGARERQADTARRERAREHHDDLTALLNDHDAADKAASKAGVTIKRINDMTRDEIADTLKGYPDHVLESVRDALAELVKAGYKPFVSQDGGGGLVARLVDKRIGVERDDQRRVFTAYMTNYLHKSREHRECAMALIRLEEVTPQIAQ